MKISDEFLETLKAAQKILDDAPIATGVRYVVNPVNQRMYKVFVSEHDCKVLEELNA